MDGGHFIGVAFAAHEDRGHDGPLRCQFLMQFNAAHAGHADVEQHHFALRFVGLRQVGDRAFLGGHGVACAAQDHGNHAAD